METIIRRRAPSCYLTRRYGSTGSSGCPQPRPAISPGLFLDSTTQSYWKQASLKAEADNRITAILRLMRTETDGSQVFYNNIYTNPIPGFNTKPNALLVSAIAERNPGRALDVCTGQGRNAVFLASQGWDVTAVDVSDEGLEIARRNAERAGVSIHTVLTSNETFDFGTAAWDLVVMTYAPVPLTAPSYVKRISQALRPGGLIVIESFASDAIEEGRTPVDIDPADLLPRVRWVPHPAFRRYGRDARLDEGRNETCPAYR